MGGNEELLERYVDEVWNRGNIDAIEKFLDPSYRRHLSPTLPPLGPDEQVARLKGLLAAFPDVRLEVEDVVTAGDRVCFRATLRGTHLGEFQGIAATGREVIVGVLDVWRIADGRVVEHWGGPDMADLTRQLTTPAAQG